VSANHGLDTKNYFRRYSSNKHNKRWECSC